MELGALSIFEFFSSILQTTCSARCQMSDVLQGEVAESSLPTQRKRERAGVSLSLCFDTWHRVWRFGIMLSNQMHDMQGAIR